MKSTVALRHRLAGAWRARTRLTSAVAMFAFALVVITWAAVAAMLRGQYVDQINDEYRQNANVASALSEQTVRVFAAIDEATHRVADGVARRQSPDLARIASETGLAPDILVQLSLIDASGRFTGSNLDPDGTKSQHVDLSARDHVRVHLAPSAASELVARVTPAGLYVGQALLGKVSGKWTIQLSRKITSEDGQPLGVVVASLDPQYFEQVYKRVSLGRTGGVALVGADLGIRARVSGGSSAGMGTMLPKGGALDAHLRTDQAHFASRSSIDGVERFVSLTQVARYPLFLAVSSGADEALSQWYYTRNATLALAALLTLGVVTASLAIVVGLHRLEHAHAALLVSEAQARSANEAKTAFLAAVSHELRTPLTSIRGYAELMEHRLAEPVFREHASLIRKGAERLNQLVSEILDLANLEAGLLKADAEEVVLRDLIESAVRRHAKAAEDKGLSMTVTLSPDVPASIDANGERVGQVLDNLLSNALKFTAHGTVQVSAEVQDDRVLVHVEDSGPGIAPEMQELVFERFRQGDARVSYEHGGTGLGLALSRGLAEVMRGSLTLQSKLGSGSRFTLAMPLHTSLAGAATG